MDAIFLALEPKMALGHPFMFERDDMMKPSQLTLVVWQQNKLIPGDPQKSTPFLDVNISAH